MRALASIAIAAALAAGVEAHPRFVADVDRALER